MTVPIIDRCSRATQPFLFLNQIFYKSTSTTKVLEDFDYDSGSFHIAVTFVIYKFISCLIIAVSMMHLYF
jgi:hypothetical protein